MQDRICQIDENLLQRTAGPYMWVKTGKAQIEHMISASHPRADICAFMNTPKRMAPTILHVGAIRDHPAAYLRRAFRSLVLPIKASDLVQTILRDARVMDQLFILILNASYRSQAAQMTF
jgi:hypothetical protein